ncbi:MAG: ribbon-helix-helix protein, CopG family [Verrucomicrobiota bacterium]
MVSESSELVKRISISLPPDAFGALDQLVNQRGFQSRSQAIAEMILKSQLEHHQKMGSEVMAGTITLFYDESRPGTLQTLAEIERRYIDEVISSQHVLLEDDHAMEVLIVQGPADLLKVITDELITCRGVKSGHLTLSTSILPPIHPLPELD